jgi:hypothetical protein
MAKSWLANVLMRMIQYGCKMVPWTVRHWLVEKKGTLVTWELFKEKVMAVTNPPRETRGKINQSNIDPHDHFFESTSSSGIKSIISSIYLFEMSSWIRNKEYGKTSHVYLSKASCQTKKCQLNALHHLVSIERDDGQQFFPCTKMEWQIKPRGIGARIQGDEKQKTKRARIDSNMISSFQDFLVASFFAHLWFW